VSGAWTLEHLGLDANRAASVLGAELLAELRQDLEGALRSLRTGSAMMPKGELPAMAANYSLAEAASIVSRLVIDDAEAIAQSDYEDLEITSGKLAAGSSRSRSFWK
jgi:hypothetical protein